MQAFESQGLPWPPAFDDGFAKKVGHLPQRQKELVFYLEHIYKGQEKETLHDINMSMQWLSVCVACSPCIVSSSRLWCRKRLGGVDLAACEALALQGFSHTAQKVADPPLTEKELVDLAGNAFNGAVVMAVVASSVAVGRWSEMPTVLSKTGAGQLSARRAAGDDQGAANAATLRKGDIDDAEEGQECGESEEGAASDTSVSPS